MPSKIVLFDPKTATRDEWRRFHAFRVERHAETEPGDPLTDDVTTEQMLKQSDPDSEVFRFAACDPERPEVQIASLTFEVFRPDSPSYQGNEHIAWLGLSVLAPFRRRGIGRMMLAEATKLAREHHKTTVQGSSQDDDGEAFLQAIGAQIGQRGLTNRLHLNQVDWGMVESWAREGAARNPGASLRWCVGGIDNDIVQPFCTAITEVFNQQPFGELEHADFVFTPEIMRTREESFKAIGGTVVTVMSVEPDSDISGLSQMGYLHSEGPIIWQWMTGVRDRYRGRGLGKWIKAAMLLRIRRDMPHVGIVTTGNATTNAPMLSINNRLGFRPHKQHVQAQMKLEALEAYLKSRNA